MILQLFLFGVGLNNYTDVVNSMGSGFAYSHPVHNIYLLLTTEGGIFQGIAYAVLLIVVLTKMLTVMRFSKSIKYQRYALVVFSSLFTLSIYNFTGWAAYHNQNYIMFTLLIGFSILIYKEYRLERKAKWKN